MQSPYHRYGLLHPAFLLSDNFAEDLEAFAVIDEDWLIFSVQGDQPGFVITWDGTVCGWDLCGDRDVHGVNAGAMCALVRKKASGG